jgi:hypothetical protein
MVIGGYLNRSPKVRFKADDLPFSLAQTHMARYLHLTYIGSATVQRALTWFILSYLVQLNSLYMSIAVLGLESTECLRNDRCLSMKTCRANHTDRLSSSRATKARWRIYTKICTAHMTQSVDSRLESHNAHAHANLQ